MFKSSFKTKIEKILEYSIPDSEMSTIDDLRCISENKIADLKALAKSDEYLSILYLKYMATKSNQDHVTGFVYDVIVGNEQAGSWYKNIVMAVSYGFEDYAKMESFREVLMPLESYSLQAGFSQIKFNMETWKGGSPYTGVPCVKLTDFDYREKVHSHLVDITDKHVILNRVDNAEVAALRWLVSRLARMIWSYLTDNQRTESELLDLIQKIVPDTKLNNAVLTSVKVLTDEMKLIGGVYNDKYPPGFIISDEHIKIQLGKGINTIDY